MIGEIDADLAAPHPMHRLLQGDVGAGKTVVAVAALLAAVQGGHQGALMAPTEVLAEQHATGDPGAARPTSRCPTTGDSLFADRPLRVELLTNRVTGAERKRILGGLADGAVDLVIGTHALIQEGVAFHSLGVVVIDEQHRFGVEQRAALREKAGAAGARRARDDGDADPAHRRDDRLRRPRRQRARRAAAGPHADRDAVGGRRSGGARRGRPCAPRSRPGARPTSCARSSRSPRSSRWRRPRRPTSGCSRGELAGLRLGLLHGRMAPAEKEATMAAFRAGELDVLVATTVIEVGVDVPNATVMVILDADRFGIAQLHQLRGRVGRGAHESQCWLVTGEPADGEDASPRVEALVATTDGFELAEVDLDLRGEGTLMSSAQKGRSDLRLASLRRDRELVRLARDAAFDIVDADPGLAANPLLLDEIELLLTPEDTEFLTRVVILMQLEGAQRPSDVHQNRHRLRGRGPSGRGSPRSGRRRCRRAPTARPSRPPDRRAAPTGGGPARRSRCT